MKNSLLGYWNSELDLEIASWFPFGVDYKPVSINELHSLRLEKIAARCLEAGSEFFFLSSMFSGCVGSLMRDNFYKEGTLSGLHLGFVMFLGYSAQMEKMLGQKLAGREDVRAGVAFCSLWNRSLFLENMKIIVVVSSSVLFDEDDFLAEFETMFEDEGTKEGRQPSSISYFAEKFGYRRFYMAFETDDITRLRISKLLYEMEFPETRQMVGPSPEMDFPPFFGINLSL
jgi:hypothetical protein